MQWILLGAMVTIALYTDIKASRIPNWLTVSGVIAGFVYQFMVSGIFGLMSALTGMLAGFLIMIILHALGALGAGDVKLFAAIGSLTGVPLVLNITMYSILYAGAVGIVILLYKKLLIDKAGQLFWSVFAIVQWKELSIFRRFRGSDMLRYPFMYAVFPAVVTVVYEQWGIG